eukprot:2389807-Karenia_brevis.AAC.1
MVRFIPKDELWSMEHHLVAPLTAAVAAVKSSPYIVDVDMVDTIKEEEEVDDNMEAPDAPCAPCDCDDKGRQ